MDTLVRDGTVFSLLPTDLHGVISASITRLQTAITRPFTQEEIKWLFEITKQFVVFYSDDQECEIQPWCQDYHSPICSSFAKQIVYDDPSITHGYHAVVPNIDALAEQIEEGSSLSIGFFDIRSHFLVTNQRLVRLGVGSLEMARKLTLAYLDKMVESLQSHPIALKLFLRESVGILGLNPAPGDKDEDDISVIQGMWGSLMMAIETMNV